MFRKIFALSLSIAAILLVSGCTQPSDAQTAIENYGIKSDMEYPFIVTSEDTNGQLGPVFFLNNMRKYKNGDDFIYSLVVWTDPTPTNKRPDGVIQTAVATVKRDQITYSKYLGEHEGAGAITLKLDDAPNGVLENADLGSIVSRAKINLLLTQKQALILGLYT